MTRAARAAVIMLVGAVAAMTAVDGARLTGPDFTEIAPQGFEDRHNSFPWGMAWWRDALYVSTNRAYSCTTQWSLHRTISDVLFPYPPTDPDLDCAADPSDLPLQAEIWRWTPVGNPPWARVYQSPLDVPNPDHPGKFVPFDMGLRTMTVHVEGDGTEALYVGGVATRVLWEGPVPPPRLLRSLDGETFVPVPQDPGTTFGTLPKGSFRTLTSYGGRLLVINGDAQGGGTVYGSFDPAAGNDAWVQITPPGMRVFEMHAFAGWLYFGTTDSAGGYSVVKTQLQGDPPYTLLPVIERGGYLTPPSDSVLSMHVFKNRLHVGTGTVFFPIHEVEVVRINPDDSWDLLVGDPRQTPDGWKVPLTGIGDGFANGFNDHIWRMQGSGDDLYVGTYDSSTEWRTLAGLLPQVEHLLGFDLFRTADGWYVTALSTDGLGDRLSFGIRNFADTPFGLIVGAANPYYGLRMWRGLAPASPPIAPPGRLETEPLPDGTLLSWQPVAGARRYVVQRTRMRTITILPGILGEPRIPGTFADIAVTAGTIYKDMPPPGEYLYVVMAVDANQQRSTASNLVQVPSRLPPMNFAGLLGLIASMENRAYFTSPQAAAGIRGAVEGAESAAAAGNVSAAIAILSVLRPLLTGVSLVKAPHNTDLEIAVTKVARRLTLARLGFPITVSASP